MFKKLRLSLEEKRSSKNLIWNLFVLIKDVVWVFFYFLFLKPLVLIRKMNSELRKRLFAFYIIKKPYRPIYFKIYPKNPVYFKKLLSFGKDAINACKKEGVQPLLFGNFAYSYYTKKKKLSIHDIDLIIFKHQIPLVIKAMNKLDYYTYYSGNDKRVDVFKKEDNLKISFNGYEEVINKYFVDVNINDVDFRLISLEGLIKRYNVAYNVCEHEGYGWKKENFSKKISELKKSK